MQKLMDDKFSRLAQFKPILFAENYSMFFNFEGFSDLMRGVKKAREMRVVKNSGDKNFKLIKINKVI